MRTQLKAKLSSLPQIDATFEFDSSPEYARELIDGLLKYYTFSQIAAHTGMSRRSIIDYRLVGFPRYPAQLALEILADRKIIANHSETIAP